VGSQSDYRRGRIRVAPSRKPGNAVSFFNHGDTHPENISAPSKQRRQ
jgi:hypothetical protein